MCGILGFNWDNKTLVRKMTDVMTHRGPDASGYYTDKNVSLGHRRLSIIDLSERGNQPMCNEDGTVWITYNGEIYNFKEIKEELEKEGHKFKSDTDTEVIIHAYEKYGESCLNHFNGIFAFCIYDTKNKRLFLARDRLGIKPLYYYINEEEFIFASEIKGIIEYDMVKREINPRALNRFVTLRYISGKETILKGIYKLEPGYKAVYDLKKKNLEVKRFWDINFENTEGKEKSEDFYKKKILEILEDSVKKRLIADVPLGAYLSGGIDSSSIVALMNKINPEGINTFSVGFEDDIVGNELGHARKISELFNTDHNEVEIRSNIVKELPKIVWHLDEPMSDPAAVPNYVLSEHAKKKVTVILTGDGADELFAGYDQYKFLMMGYKMRNLPPFIRKIMMPAMIKAAPLSVLNKVYQYSSATGKKMFERFANFIAIIDTDKAKAYHDVVSVFDEQEKKELFSENLNSQTNNSYLKEVNKKYFNNNTDFLNQLLYMDMKTYLAEDLLMKPDKMCMAFGIEARVPYLDYRLVEFAANIPQRLKLKGLTTKYILKKSLQEVIPKEVIYRKKQPFQVPLDRWISKDLKGLFRDLLSEQEIKKQGFFREEYIEKIFKNYDKSRLYYGRQLWSLVNFALWHKIYIEKQKPKSIRI